MHHEEFRKLAHQTVDWIADYFGSLDEIPVKPDVQPGAIKAKLPAGFPEEPESFARVMADFQNIILPGMTHWQHPGFFAYFPAGSSGPSVLAEMLTSALGAQCMVWLTSPAAEELEERMMEWLRDLLHLPGDFTGVIQDSSSSATLVALLTAREVRSSWQINRLGFEAADRYRVYTSDQGHSSIDKGVRIAGIGIENLVRIPVDSGFGMRPELLEQAIREDLAAGFFPLCVVSTLGTTSSTAVDPLDQIGAVCHKFNVWHHIDASYAGTALMLPEMAAWGRGIGLADSFVVNPHKWMFTNFDCSAYFVKDKEALIRTFSILPEYLKTPEDQKVNNYRDWGIPLGRRFRALKLWFVIRMHGAEGLRTILREHIRLGQWLRNQMEAETGFHIMAPVHFNLVCFRYVAEECRSEEEIDRFNETLLAKLNQSGRIFLTHTRLNGRFVLRFVGGNERTAEERVREAWELIRSTARQLAG